MSAQQEIGPGDLVRDLAPHNRPIRRVISVFDGWCMLDTGVSTRLDRVQLVRSAAAPCHDNVATPR